MTIAISTVDTRRVRITSRGTIWSRDCVPESEPSLTRSTFKSNHFFCSVLKENDEKIPLNPAGPRYKSLKMRDKVEGVHGHEKPIEGVRATTIAAACMVGRGLLEDASGTLNQSSSC